jgi:hypothetical protein
MLAGVSTDRSESAELRRFGRGAADLPRDCRAAGCPGDWDPVIGEPMFAGVSMGQSESRAYFVSRSGRIHVSATAAYGDRVRAHHW